MPSVAPEPIVVAVAKLTAGVAAELLLIVRLLNVVAALPPMLCVLLPLKVTVPVSGMKLPEPALLVQLPVREMLLGVLLTSSVPAVRVRLPVSTFDALSVIVAAGLLMFTLPVNDAGHSLPVDTLRSLLPRFE